MKKYLGVLGVASLLGGPAFAADLYTKAPAAVAPSYLDEWSGIYVGLEGGYGWGSHGFGAFNRIPGFGGVDDSGTVNFPQFVGANVGSIKQNGWLAGGFVGAQKQFGSWVLGIEADFDAAGIKGSGSATGTTIETLTGPGQLFSVTQPFTTSPVNLTIPGQTITSTGSTAPFSLTLPGQTVTVNGQTITLPDQKVTVPGQTVNSSGNVVIPDQTLQGVNVTASGTGTGTLTIPTLTVAGKDGTQITIPTVSINLVGKLTSSGLNPGDTIPIGGSATLTVKINGYNVPITLSNVVNPITIPQSGNANVSLSDVGQASIKLGGTTVSTGQTSASVPVTVNVNGTTDQITVPGQTVAVNVSGTTADQKITIPGQTVVVNGQTIKLPDQTFTIPGQTITSTGQTAPQTVTVPGQTIPGQKNPVLNANGTPFISPVGTTFAGVSVTRSTQVDTKIDELGSLRGRIGFAVAPNWLIYGTGGLAWAHATNTVTATETVSIAGIGAFSNSRSLSGGATLLGWAAGGGIDWKMTPNWILGAEYLHYEFPKNTIGLSDGSVSANFSNSRQSVDAVKGRISYMFPIH